MPMMHYKAMDVRGRMQSGQNEAVNAADLEMRLTHLGLDLINCHEAKINASTPGRRVDRRDVQAVGLTPGLASMPSAHGTLAPVSDGRQSRPACRGGHSQGAAMVVGPV